MGISHRKYQCEMTLLTIPLRGLMTRFQKLIPSPWNVNPHLHLSHVQWCRSSSKKVSRLMYGLRQRSSEVAFAPGKRGRTVSRDVVRSVLSLKWKRKSLWQPVGRSKKRYSWLYGLLFHISLSPSLSLSLSLSLFPFYFYLTCLFYPCTYIPSSLCLC